MRITEYEKNAIIDSVKSADPDAKLWLFGSCADDSKKGGDIDIAIFSETIKRELKEKYATEEFDKLENLTS